MNKSFRGASLKTVISLAIAASVVMGKFTPLSMAQDATTDVRPAVVVSVASIEQLFGDIGYLSKAAGMTQIGGFVTLLATPYLQDVDTRSPAGMYVSLAGGRPSGVVFIGTSRFSDLLRKIEEQAGKAEDLGGGLYRLSLQGDVFIKQQGSWVFASNDAAHVATVPVDPSQFLLGLNQSYTLAVRVNATSIPHEMKAMAVERLKAESQRGLERELAGKSADERRQAELAAQQGLEMLTSLVEDTDQVTIGLGTDSRAGKTFLETTVTAVPGTRLADHLAKSGTLPSQVGGVDLPGSSVVLQYNLPVPPAAITAMSQNAPQLRARAMQGIDRSDRIPDESVRSALKNAANALIDVLVATVQQGQLQGTASVCLTPGAVQVVAGAAVADGAKIEPALRQVAEAVKGRSGGPTISLAVRTHRNVNVHSLKIPVADSDGEVRKAFGPQVDVALGTSPRQAYIAIGPNAVNLLTRALDGAIQAKTSPLRFRAAVTPVLAFAAAIDNDPAVGSLAKAMESAKGKDNVTLDASPVEHGIRYRLEVEEGVLGLLREVAKLRVADGDEP